jgi:hypothetical protein
MKDAIQAQEARTARILALALSGTLGFSVFLQYLVLAVLACSGHEKEIPAFEHLFGAWLPIIAGLTGAAVSHYYDRRPQLTPQNPPNHRRVGRGK